MLHKPCQRLVREVSLAEGLCRDASPQIGFYLPGPTGVALAPPPLGLPHYRRLNLSAPVEQLGTASSPHPLTGVTDHAAVLAATLRRAGRANLRFRGWRCQMTYPVPLVEMLVGFRFESLAR